MPRREKGDHGYEAISWWNCFWSNCTLISTIMLKIPTNLKHFTQNVEHIYIWIFLWKINERENILDRQKVFLLLWSVTVLYILSKPAELTLERSVFNETPFLCSEPERDDYIRIFEHIGHEYIFGHSFVSIFLLRIYSDIRSCQICLYEYIRTFVGECVRV